MSDMLKNFSTSLVEVSFLRTSVEIMYSSALLSSEKIESQHYI